MRFSRFLFLLSIIFFQVVSEGCSDYSDYFEALNKAPKLTLNNQTELFDTLKIGFTHKYTLVLQDEEKLPVTISPSENDSIRVEKGQVIILAKEEKDYTLSFSVVDSYKQSATSVLHLHSFKNLAPIASLKITGNETIELDASGSRDLDSSFGGNVVLYNYKINGFVIESPQSKIHYVFETSGLKSIKLKVLDNEGCWSNEISMTHAVTSQ